MSTAPSSQSSRERWAPAIIGSDPGDGPILRMRAPPCLRRRQSFLRGVMNHSTNFFARPSGANQTSHMFE